MADLERNSASPVENGDKFPHEAPRTLEGGPVNLAIKTTRDYIAIITAGGHVSCFHEGMLGVAEGAEQQHLGVIGFKDGFSGAKKGRYYDLNSRYLKKCIYRGGSVIGSSRDKVDDPKLVKSTLEKLHANGINVKGIVGMAGDDHLKQLRGLYIAEGIPVVGWPKTMDNDLSRTWRTLGYATAGTNAAAAVRRGHDGAWTNNRVHIMTMFGRDADWMVAAAGAWGAADVVVGGERECGIDKIYERALQAVDQNQKDYGRRFAVLAVSEGASIKGIENYVDEFTRDAHDNPKLQPEQLALAIQKGFKGIDKALTTSIDTLTYDALRNCGPVMEDRDKAYDAGLRCVEELLMDRSDVCVVIDQEGQGETLGTAPLSEVAEKRYLSPLEFMDYDAMKPTPAFVKYYTPLFGRPLSREEVLFSRLEERRVGWE